MSSNKDQDEYEFDIIDWDNDRSMNLVNRPTITPIFNFTDDIQPTNRIIHSRIPRPRTETIIIDDDELEDVQNPNVAKIIPEFVEIPPVKKRIVESEVEEVPTVAPTPQETIYTSKTHGKEEEEEQEVEFLEKAPQTHCPITLKPIDPQNHFVLKGCGHKYSMEVYDTIEWGKWKCQVICGHCRVSKGVDGSEVKDYTAILDKANSPGLSKPKEKKVVQIKWCTTCGYKMKGNHSRTYIPLGDGKFKIRMHCKTYWEKREKGEE